MANQTIFHGSYSLPILSDILCRLSRPFASQRIHSRHDSVGCRSLHSNGFVWSQLTKGDPNYTLVQVSINDLIMIFAFAPLAGLLLGLSEITVPWNTLIISVLLYVVVPLVAGLLTRAYFLKNNEMPRLDNLIVRFKPLSIAGLLVTVILLFGFQANKILAQPQAIFLIAVPLVIQTYGIFALAYFLAIRIKLSFNIAAPRMHDRYVQFF